MLKLSQAFVKRVFTPEITIQILHFSFDLSSLQGFLNFPFIYDENERTRMAAILETAILKTLPSLNIHVHTDMIEGHV